MCTSGCTIMYTSEAKIIFFLIFLHFTGPFWSHSYLKKFQKTLLLARQTVYFPKIALFCTFCPLPKWKLFFNQNLSKRKSSISSQLNMFEREDGVIFMCWYFPGDFNTRFYVIVKYSDNLLVMIGHKISHKSLLC